VEKSHSSKQRFGAGKEGVLEEFAGEIRNFERGVLMLQDKKTPRNGGLGGSKRRGIGGECHIFGVM
jgi:hypothetical protein